MLCGSHIKIWNLANHMKKKMQQRTQTLSFQLIWNIYSGNEKILQSLLTQKTFSILMFFVLFFHLVWKISNFNSWTKKHLAQASGTEFPGNVNGMQIFPYFSKRVPSQISTGDEQVNNTLQNLVNVVCVCPQKLLRIAFNPNWHFYPPCNFGIKFCQLNFWRWKRTSIRLIW